MSKYTTSIYELLASEGYKHGFNDFLAPDGMHLITYGDNLAFINKVNAYDKDIQTWADTILFGGGKLTSPGADLFFKKEFVARFINREIKYQTVDLWRIKLTAEMVQYDQWLSNTYDNFTKIFTGEKDGKTTGNLLANQANTSNTDFTGKVTSDTNTVTRHRDLDATLPQNETELNLDSDTVAYADSRKDSKDKSNNHSVTDTKNVTDTTANQNTTQDTTGTSQDIVFDIDIVNKIRSVYSPVFKELDRRLFLQIW